MHLVAQIIEIMAVVFALCSVGYYGLCLWGARGFVRQKATQREPNTAKFTPPISILKPLKGIDPEIEASFRSHCLQDYPNYEVIFGVSDSADPAAEVVKKIQREFPHRRIQLINCPNKMGSNIKVSTLAQMLQAAGHDYLIVNDSDIRVPPDYLSSVVRPLMETATGLVTCLYRGVAAPTLGSWLESVGISTDFCTGVLAAHILERGIHFGLGSTLAFRRMDLQEIGGFESFKDHLADDYELGSRIAAKGKRVELSETVVDTFLPAYTLGEYVRHQLRWNRTIRGVRGWGYIGLCLTYGIPWALLALALSRGALWAWGVLMGVVVLRLAVALFIGRAVLRDQQVIRLLWLIPLRDISGLLLWGAGFFGNKIAWRGDSFRLKDGKLARIGP